MNEYEQAHADLDAQDEPAQAKPVVQTQDELPAPAANAVRSAYDQARDEDAKAFSDAFNAEAAPVTQGEAKGADLAPMPEKLKSFKEAFAAARKDGLKVFDFNGKKFTTEMKAKAKAAEAVSAPAPDVKAPEVRVEAPVAKADKSIYDDNTFPKNVINAVKAKLNDNAQAAKAKTLANGKPNLTAQ